jgi:hypothetical protein
MIFIFIHSLKYINIFLILHTKSARKFLCFIVAGASRFSEAAGLERGPLSLVSITEELLGRNSSGSG